jgi:O-antigen/teichoic acid export membrane protein
MTDASVPVAEQGDGSDAPGTPTKSRRQRVKDASVLSALTYGFRTIVRLGQWLVLGLLLEPAVYGVVTIARAILLALEQFSDIGLKSSIVYHERGAEQSFLDTAWTMKVVRGIVLWLIVCAIAGPVAGYYPDLHGLLVILPVLGFSSVIRGLFSNSINVQQRNISPLRPMVIVWITAIVTVTVMLTWAYYSPTAWALVAGALAAELTQLTLSWVILPGPHPRFGWDSRAFKALVNFGKWIVLSTLIGFLSMHFLKFFLPKFVPAGLFGLFGLATICANVPNRFVNHLSNWVLIPLFAEYNRNPDIDLNKRSRPAFHKVMPAFVLIMVTVCVISPVLFAYYPREAYRAAGPIAVWGGAAMWFWTLQNTPRSLLLAKGRSRGVMLMTWSNATATLIFVPLGFWIGQSQGWGGYWQPGSEYAVGLSNSLGWIGVAAAVPMGGTPSFAGVVESGSAPALAGVYLAIVGTGLGNLAGCVAGWYACRRAGIYMGGILVGYSALFLLAVVGSVVLTIGGAQLFPGLETREVAAIVAVLVLTPLALWAWSAVGRMLLRKPKGGPA